MKSETLKRPLDFRLRTAIFLTGVAIIFFVYIFQRMGTGAVVENLRPNTIFIISRTTRLLVNDLACFLIIFALFRERKYLKIAFWVFLAELLVILPVYLLVKLTLEGDSEISSPLLSQVHRLIVNPMLMILLMAGFFYQRFFKK